MTIYDLKPAFQKLLLPCVKFINGLGITPNHITVFTLVISLLFSGLLYLDINNYYVLISCPIFMLLRMALNAIDGLMATRLDLKTNVGASLNEITDVLADSFFYLAFIQHNHIPNILLIVFIILAITSEVAGMSVLHFSKDRRFDGPLGKSDRAFVFSIIAILLATESMTQRNFEFLFLFLNILCLLTIYKRVKKAL